MGSSRSLPYLCAKLQQWKSRKRNPLQEPLLPKSQRQLWPVESTHFPKPKPSDDMPCVSRTNLEREFQLPSAQRKNSRPSMLRKKSKVVKRVGAPKVRKSLTPGTVLILLAGVH